MDYQQKLIENRRLFWDALWSKKDFDPIWANRECPIEIQEAYQDKIIYPNSKVLDVGCGLGEIAHWFSINHFQVDAFDISTSAINKAILKFGNDNIKFFNHDLCTTPLTQR